MHTILVALESNENSYLFCLCLLVTCEIFHSEVVALNLCFLFTLCPWKGNNCYGGYEEVWVMEKFKVLKYVVICFINQCAFALCSVPRSGSPSSSLVNGSPHPSYKREPTTSPADYEYKKNVEFLKRGKELIYVFE